MTPDGVTRLPVQHPRAPHCTGCGAALPTFDGARVSVPLGCSSVDLVSVTYHMRCGCGLEWDVKKTIDNERTVKP